MVQFAPRPPIPSTGLYRIENEGCPGGKMVGENPIKRSVTGKSIDRMPDLGGRDHVKLRMPPGLLREKRLTRTMPSSEHGCEGAVRRGVPAQYQG